MSLAATVAVAGVVCLVAGLCLAAFLVWSALAALAVGLVVVGALASYAGLFLDLDRKE